MRKRRLPNLIILLMLFIGLLLAFMTSFILGRYPVPIRELFGIIGAKFVAIKPFWSEQMEIALFNIRLPRILLACMVGCCLSAAGAAYQGVFKNPMASPDILGASQGAAFGAALAILLGAGSRMTAVAAFCMSLITVSTVFLIGTKAHGKQVLSLVLSGIMVSSLFQAGTSFIKLVADPTNQLPAITYWLMGSLSGSDMGDVKFVAPPMAAGLLALLLLRWRLNVLTLGDEEARTLGVNTQLVRYAVILCATLVTAASVSVSGMIGWVGLVIPHLARRLVGNDYRYLMPASMFLGAGFLLIVDDVSRNLLSVEIPLGILTAFVGAPFFLHMILRKGERI